MAELGPLAGRTVADVGAAATRRRSPPISPAPKTGAIVNIASVAAFGGSPERPSHAYAASKGAVPIARCPLCLASDDSSFITGPTSSSTVGRWPRGPSGYTDRA